MASKKQLFDLKELEDKFRAAKTVEGNVSLDEYATAFLEIACFYELLGTTFGFAAKIIRDNVKILRAYRVARSGEEFTTLRSLVEREIQESESSNSAANSDDKKEKKKKKKQPSIPVSRAALDLHRMLVYVTRFLDRLKDMPDDGLTSTIAAEEYKATLAKYDLWVVQKVAVLAAKTLPTKKVFVEKNVKQTIEEAEAMAPSTIGIIMEVIDIANKVFDDNKILELK